MRSKLFGAGAAKVIALALLTFTAPVWLAACGGGGGGGGSGGTAISPPPPP
ncbi:peptidase family protein, partial [Hyphomonas hirschiana VP5]